MVKLLFITLWLAAHPVHVSLLSIDYAPDKELFNVFLRIYYDDFLLDSGIDKNGDPSLKFTDYDTFTKDFIGNYINEKIKIIADNKQLSGVLEGYNLEGNELTTNLSFGSVKKVTTITIKNDIMTKLYSDQANMLIVRVDDFEQGIKMTSDETEQTFRIK